MIFGSAQVPADSEATTLPLPNGPILSAGALASALDTISVFFAGFADFYQVINCLFFSYLPGDP